VSPPSEDFVTNRLTSPDGFPFPSYPAQAKYAFPLESTAPPLGSDQPRSELVLCTILLNAHVSPPSCETDA
jgi:hypothetical protein